MMHATSDGWAHLPGKRSYQEMLNVSIPRLGEVRLLSDSLEASGRRAGGRQFGVFHRPFAGQPACQLGDRFAARNGRAHGMFGFFYIAFLIHFRLIKSSSPWSGCLARK
ncbi:hypothetical protein D3C78_1116250 [compost metagenome]